MSHPSQRTATPRPLRVLHLIAPSRISGAERMAVELCKGLQSRGHQVVVGCKQGSPFLSFAHENGLECLALAIGGKLNLCAVPRIREVIRQRNIDLVHTHLSTASLWGSLAGRSCGIPVIAHVQALNNKFCFLFADRLIACSEAVRDFLCQQHVEAEHIEVIYNTVDLTRFKVRTSKEDAKQKLGFDADCLLIGVIAHLSTKKGHAYLLRAVARLVPDFPTLRIVLVGEGPEHGPLVSLAERLGVAQQTVFAGHQADIVPFLNAMDILVLPSIAMEGLPVALIEAGAMQVPAVATDVGGASEVIEHGTTGYIVPPRNVEALKDALQHLVSNPEMRRAMGVNAQKRVCCMFGVETMVDSVERLYDTLVRRERYAVE